MVDFSQKSLNSRWNTLFYKVWSLNNCIGFRWELVLKMHIPVSILKPNALKCVLVS